VGTQRKEGEWVCLFFAGVTAWGILLCMGKKKKITHQNIKAAFEFARNNDIFSSPLPWEYFERVS